MLLETVATRFGEVPEDVTAAVQCLETVEPLRGLLLALLAMVPSRTRALPRRGPHQRLGVVGRQFPGLDVGLDLHTATLLSAYRWSRAGLCGAWSGGPQRVS
jgi:hypothetical protein